CLHADESQRLESPPRCIVLVVTLHDRCLAAVRPHSLCARTACAPPSLPRICFTQQGSCLRSGDGAPRARSDYSGVCHRRWRSWPTRRIALKGIAAPELPEQPTKL